MTLNRKQRRQLDKNGYDGNKISDIISAADSIKYIQEGEKVKLDVKKITGREDWQKLTERYRSFVMSNVNTIFTVQYEEKYGDKPSLVTFVEDNTWLWWTGDLIVLKDVK
jgi:hypothetical protein